jgi:hypothetical protein
MIGAPPLTRRALLQVAASTVALLAGDGSSRVNPARTATAATLPVSSAPPNVLLLHLNGGMDAVLTTDPKTRCDVADDIDLPYEEEAIRTVGTMRFGPHARSLVPFAEDLVFINGVAVRTAGHVPGFSQVLRCKLGYHGDEPPILDLIGAHRRGEPLTSMALGQPLMSAYSSAGFRADALVHRAEHLSPDDRRLLAKTLRAQAAGLRAESKGDRTLVTAHNIEDAAAFLDRLDVVPPLEVETWSANEKAQGDAKSLQTVLWAFRNQITRTAVLSVEQWDSHSDNVEVQQKASYGFFPLLARCLGEMKRREPDGTRLLDRTLIVAMSELGRFPVLNAMNGKDHYPEIPVILAGGPLGDSRGQAYGLTDRDQKARPVSLRTGKSVGRAPAVLDLDDLGATLLRASHVEPTTYGYHGRPLEFLRLG